MKVISYKTYMFITVFAWLLTIGICYLIEGSFTDHWRNIVPSTIVFTGLCWIPRSIEFFTGNWQL